MTHDRDGITPAFKVKVALTAAKLSAFSDVNNSNDPHYYSGRARGKVFAAAHGSVADPAER